MPEISTLLFSVEFLPLQIRVYKISEPLFFEAANVIEHITVKDFTTCLVLRMRGVTALDSTAIDEVNGQLGEKGAKDINEILEANRALFAGGELDEEAKDAFYQAVTKAYLSCKMEAKKTFGRKKKNTEMESDS